jgi:stage II sporulation protein D
MSIALVLVCLASFSLPKPHDATIRIGLFSLFKPQQLEIRVASGQTAILGFGSNQEKRISSNDTIRIRRYGRSLSFGIDSAQQPAGKTIAGELRVWSAGPTTLLLSIPGRIERTVQGRVSVTALEPGQGGWLNVVLESDIENAVLSAVAAELAGESETEAIKALAVAARSFLESGRDRHRSQNYDLCDTTHCQLYKGTADPASNWLADAVASTENETLRFNNHPVAGYYTAACGGWTATPQMIWGGTSETAYQYVEKLCDWCERSRYRNWERSASVRSVIDALRGSGYRVWSDATQISTQRHSKTGLVLKVVIQDRDRRIILSADQFRRRLGLSLGWNTVLSPSFTVERRGAAFIFRGHGFGSQVGICVAGALAQAANGRSYRSILEFYYPQTEIVKSPSKEGDH